MGAAVLGANSNLRNGGGKIVVTAVMTMTSA
jgi:hypothetical protein